MWASKCWRNIPLSTSGDNQVDRMGLWRDYFPTPDETRDLFPNTTG